MLSSSKCLKKSTSKAYILRVITPKSQIEKCIPEMRARKLTGRKRRIGLQERGGEFDWHLVSELCANIHGWFTVFTYKL